jgi:hypothetical protein
MALPKHTACNKESNMIWYNRANRHVRSRGSLQEEITLFAQALAVAPHADD